MVEGLLDLASAFGLSTSAGLNAYIPLLAIAVLGRWTSLVELEPPWSALTNGWIIALLVVLLAVETLADKIPAVDTANDVVQTLIRPTAGAVLFAATTQPHLHLHPMLAMACGVILAGGVHTVKASVRPVLTATTGGIANPIVSTLEDGISAIVSFLSILIPILVVIWVLLCAALLILIWRFRR